MPSEQTLNWADAGSNGSYTVGSGATSTGVTVATTTNADGQTANVATDGSPAAQALWVDGLNDAVTTTLTFDTPVENLSFELFDVDQNGILTDERVTILATDAEGNIYPVAYGDLDALHSVADGQLDADGQNSAATDTSGAADTVSVSIAGPITTLEIIFDHGESASQTGKLGLSDIAFSNAPDGIVEGDDTANLIDLNYLDDPEGDKVTTGDDSVLAGDGNDTVYGNLGNDSIDGGLGDDFLIGDQGDDTLIGGAGNDSMIGGDGDDVFLGGDGNDTVETSAGNDVFYGGAGDDRVNGDLGNDELHGGTGNDFLRGSYGNDTIHSGGAGEGDDYLWGGYGDDLFVIENQFGNDTIAAENIDETLGDTMDLSAVTDAISVDLTDSATGAGTVSDGTSTLEFEAVENIKLSSGQDTIVLADGSGKDAVMDFQAPIDNGDGTFSAQDKLDVTGMTNDAGATQVTTNDVTVSSDTDGNAVLAFPGGEAITLIGISPDSFDTPAALEAIGIPPAPDGYFSGTDGNDVINVGDLDADGDRIDGNDATSPGMSGDDDHILAGAGDDLVFSGAGNDSFEGGAGSDTIYASVGDDTLIGCAGSDSLMGEDGDDVFESGDGADYMDGGAGSDLFRNVSAGDTVFGGESGDDVDTLDLTGLGPLRIVQDPFDSEAGEIELLDDAGNVTGTVTYEGIETIVPCFTPGSQIATDMGLKNVEDIEVGDRVITRDHGSQVVRWTGKRDLTDQDLKTSPFLRPICISAGALGPDLPHKDMLVSPNHRILISDQKAQMLLGASEVLVAAKHLVGSEGVTRADVTEICYVHLLCDRHEILWSDGIWSESFQPGVQAMAGLNAPQRSEIYTLFPDLKDAPATIFKTARTVVRRHEATIFHK
ncbi:MAG: Hint domain-containing protein [Cognatishimia sp.]